MKIRFAVLVVAGVVAIAACGGETATIELVDTGEAVELLAGPPADLVVLDVRTPEEYDTGKIEDAVNIDFYAEDFAAQLEELDRDAPYFVYCRSGNRSATTIETMRELGFTDVHELDGGIVAWTEAGLPLQP